ncbi:MAG: hypothetical protein H6Q72_3533 [Firmicutes bacterium]|nr:hypothetical protein [Bacillota bacterium]
MSEEQDCPNIIEADGVVLEVIDKNTGKTFRRSLPLAYLETGNGVVLSGENLDGKPAQISFLSDVALTKINDLIGKGPDHDRCGSKTTAEPKS